MIKVARLCFMLMEIDPPLAAYNLKQQFAGIVWKLL